MDFCRLWKKCNNWNGCNNTMESPTCFEGKQETYLEAIEGEVTLRKCNLIGESIIQTGWNALSDSLKAMVVNNPLTSYSIRTERVVNEENECKVHIVMEIILPIKVRKEKSS